MPGGPPEKPAGDHGGGDPHDGRPGHGEPPAWAVHLPDGMDPAGVDLLAGRSLAAAWGRLAAAEPRRPVLWQAERGWRTRGELDEASRVVAARLHRAGLRPGDRLACSAASSLEVVVVHLAALRLGLVMVPANPAYSERELAATPPRSTRPGRTTRR